MRKLICLLTAMLLCMSLSISAFAAEGFVPSVSYQDNPPAVMLEEENGESAIAVIRNASDDSAFYVTAENLIMTSVLDARNQGDKVSAEGKMLLEVYEALSDGSMELPYAELGDVNADNMVVRDLFDVSFASASTAGQNYTEITSPEGVFLEITFDLGVPAGVRVYAMTYNDGQWAPIRETRNNDDGTVTCVFEHLCPVVFCVEELSVQETEPVAAVETSPASVEAETVAAQESVTPESGSSNTAIWAGIMAVCAVALVAVVVIGRKKRA